MISRTVKGSSHLAAIGHDPETNVMEVTYSSGLKYRYSDITPEMYDSIWADDSPGRGLRSVIHSEGVTGTRVVNPDHNAPGVERIKL